MRNRIHQNYLTADANHPLITSSSFQTEALLYNLSASAQKQIADAFLKICNKKLDPLTHVTAYSGGERVVLMALMSLYCPAPRLRFIDLWHALDSEKRLLMQALIEKSEKDIILEDSKC